LILDIGARASKSFRILSCLFAFLASSKSYPKRAIRKENSWR
jgi:hypothetical protein